MKTIQLNKSLGYLFHNISLSMRKRLEKDIAEFDLPTAHQYGVLVLLSKESMSQKEISNATLADEPSTTRMLDRMIKKNLIGKEKSKEDKRKQIVYITENGKELLEKILPIVSKNNNYVEEILDEDELKSLYSILNKINSRMQK